MTPVEAQCRSQSDAGSLAWPVAASSVAASSVQQSVQQTLAAASSATGSDARLTKAALREQLLALANDDAFLDDVLRHYTQL